MIFPRMPFVSNSLRLSIRVATPLFVTNATEKKNSSHLFSSERIVGRTLVSCSLLLIISLG